MATIKRRNTKLSASRSGNNDGVAPNTTWGYVPSCFLSHSETLLVYHIRRGINGNMEPVLSDNDSDRKATIHGENNPKLVAEYESRRKRKNR